MTQDIDRFLKLYFTLTWKLVNLTFLYILAPVQLLSGFRWWKSKKCRWRETSGGSASGWCRALSVFPELNIVNLTSLTISSLNWKWN